METFNGDGFTDIFWRNFTTGQTTAWLMVDGRIDASPGLANALLLGMVAFRALETLMVMASPTSFWRNFTTGQTTAWLMVDGRIDASPGLVDAPPSSGWSVQGFGDFDGDGFTDIFWRNFTTGQTTAWLMRRRPH